MTRLFTSPIETTFRYCDGDLELLDYGGEPASVDPLAILWTGLAAHGGAREIVDATLARLGDAPLRLHPQATIARLGLAESEARVVDHLQRCPEGIRALAARSILPIERLHQLVYALTITRQFDIGSPAQPVGALDVPKTTTVARVQLRPTAHRVGAAAPDAPGDGERGATSTKPTTGPRKTIMTPRGTQPSVELASSTAVPRKASVEDRETLKSAESARAADPERHVSVEIINLALAPTPAIPKAPLVGAEADVADTPPSSPHSPLRGLSANDLFTLAGARLLEHDLAGAERACSRARVVDPDNVDCAALASWIEAQQSGADVKALTVQLDELLGAAPYHRSARYYRAMLRKRLGDDAGAIRDLRRILQQTPDDADALKALDALDGPPEKSRASVLGWLFKR